MKTRVAQRRARVEKVLHSAQDRSATSGVSRSQQTTAAQPWGRGASEVGFEATSPECPDHETGRAALEGPQRWRARSS
jgi:hypothetical protein